MLVLAIVELREDVACNAACQMAVEGVPVRHRLKVATQRIIRERPEAVAIRWARLARQDAEDMTRRTARGKEPSTAPRYGAGGRGLE